MKSDRCKVFPRVALNLGLAVRSHIFAPNHLEFLPHPPISTLHNKLMGENVCQFGAIAVPSSDHLLLVIIVVASS